MEYGAELLRRVRSKIDTPDGYIGEAQWSDADIADALRDAYSHIWGEVSNIDANFGVKRDATLTISSGSTTFSLPTDCRVLQKILETETLGGEVSPRGEIPVGTVNDAATTAALMAIWEPDDNRIWFPRAPTRDIPVLVHYGYWPQPLAHGCVRAATGTTIQLAEYESIEDDVHNGQSIYIYDGFGAGQSAVISDYDGSTRTATVPSWTTVPNTTSEYTMRPALPRDATDALVYEIAGRLLETAENENYPAMFRARERHLRKMEETLRKRDRRVARHIRNDAGYNHRDPYKRGYLR